MRKPRVQGDVAAVVGDLELVVDVGPLGGVEVIERQPKSVMKSLTSWDGVMLTTRRRSPGQVWQFHGHLVAGDDVGEDRRQGQQFGGEVAELSDSGHGPQAGAGGVDFHGAHWGGGEGGTPPVVDVGDTGGGE